MAQWVEEGPFYVTEGETRRFVVVFRGAQTIASAVDDVYANGSSQAVLTGSVSTGVNSVTTRLLTVPSGAGGLTYVWQVGAVVNGEFKVGKIQLEVARPGQEL